MSWLARSIANDGEEEEEEDDRPTISNDHHRQSVKPQQGSDSETLTEGVKGDLTESLARQIWGVASFLAPPPPLRHRASTAAEPDRHHIDDCNDVSDSICEDSRFGGEIGVTNSSTFFNDDQKENDRDFVGVTDEVLQFAMNIAHHPETWLDFPLSEEEDSDDFEMSDTQWNHATLVEHLVPRLAALRIEFCPIHMSESYFWKVYFVLLHPRLNKHDADLLSTPQIVAARAMWMKELQLQTKPESDNHEDYNTNSSDTSSSANMPPILTKEEKSTNGPSEPRVVSSFTTPVEDFGEDEDDWIHENSELDGYVGPDVHDEDISFSDLEDDDCTMPIRSNINII